MSVVGHTHLKWRAFIRMVSGGVLFAVLLLQDISCPLHQIIYFDYMVNWMNLPQCVYKIITLLAYTDIII